MQFSLFSDMATAEEEAFITGLVGTLSGFFSRNQIAEVGDHSLTPDIIPSSQISLRYIITGLTVEEEETEAPMLSFSHGFKTFLDAIPSLLLLIIVSLMNITMPATCHD